MKNSAKKVPLVLNNYSSTKKMVDIAIENYDHQLLSEEKMDWDSQVGLEIIYQMYKFADRGFFDNKDQIIVNGFLSQLVFIAKAGFETAKSQISNNIKF